MSTPVGVVVANLDELFQGLLQHEGFGELRVEVRLLKRGQKEVILHCGKQYRFVVDVPARTRPVERADVLQGR